ncbi:class I SAM-dependent methyltransferase [Monashia sp. NPDC004114]
MNKRFEELTPTSPDEPTIESYTWPGGTARGSRPLFGESAKEYDNVRPGYDQALVAEVLLYAQRPDSAVEIGAGTGKATAAFIAAGISVACVEPDPAMADRLASKFTAEHVVVHRHAFEDWWPSQSQALIYCAQAWHWLDPEARCHRAADVLAPGGALALFGHRYLLADPEMEAKIDAVYRDVAPQLLGDPELRGVPADRYWYTDELRESSLYTDIQTADFRRVIRFDVETYLRLVATFSSHRQLDPMVLTVLLEGIGRAVDGGHVDVDLATVLALGRTPRS